MSRSHDISAICGCQWVAQTFFCVLTCLLILFVVTPCAFAQQWLVDANARIEQHRKANLIVVVVDNLGNPVPGAHVHVEMTRHSFGFGTAVTVDCLTDLTLDGLMYKHKLLENFNHVAFENELRWPAWVGLWGPNYTWTNTQLALNWLDFYNLPTRGHYLSYGTWSGPDAYGESSDTETLPARLFDHITDIATTVGNRVFEWDVINHPVGWLQDTYENRIGPDFFGEIIDHARSVVPPGMPLWINEDDIVAGQKRADDYERIIRALIARGSPPDGIGFQGHFIEQWGRVSASPLDQIYDRIERFAVLIDRLRFTEFDIDVGPDEALQAQLMHDYLTVIFSHPNVEAITMWGFWGGAHWRGENAALYRSDWSAKPSLTAYQNLVFRDWWTNVSGVSNRFGGVITRAFKGHYAITVTYAGQVYVIPDYLLESDVMLRVIVSRPVPNLGVPPN